MTQTVLVSNGKITVVESGPRGPRGPAGPGGGGGDGGSTATPVVVVDVVLFNLDWDMLIGGLTGSAPVGLKFAFINPDQAVHEGHYIVEAGGTYTRLGDLDTTQPIFGARLMLDPSLDASTVEDSGIVAFGPSNGSAPAWFPYSFGTATGLIYFPNVSDWADLGLEVGSQSRLAQCLDLLVAHLGTETTSPQRLLPSGAEVDYGEITANTVLNVNSPAYKFVLADGASMDFTFSGLPVNQYAEVDLRIYNGGILDVTGGAISPTIMGSVVDRINDIPDGYARFFRVTVFNSNGEYVLSSITHGETHLDGPDYDY